MSKKFVAILVVGILTATAYFAIPYIQKSIYAENAEASLDDVEVIVQDTIPAEPQLLYGINIDSKVIIEDKVQRNQNISEILTKYNVSAEAIYHLAQRSKDVFDVRKIAANKKYTLICDSDSLNTAQALVYEHNPIEYVIFNLMDSIFVEKKEREVKFVEKSVAGVIESNLSMTMQSLGLSHILTNEFVDVFGWQVDFFGLQKGDKFKLIYEDKIVEDQSVGIGKIKAIYFEHYGKDLYAFIYDQGEGIDYFDEEGNSLRKAFLKYPLEFSRISSRYSGSRYHPVQKRYKAHLGTDFAANKGTPIRAVGDGVITEAKFQKYNGNYVKVKHNGTYTTQYLHMSKIASGIRSGVRVSQGQVIGYVGSTGLATGNHLCYRFWKNGVQVDALKVEIPPSEPIKEDHKDAFFVERDSWIKKLEEISMPEETEPVMASASLR
jgi:murein DD-endopeptidase MepM/ murein hydrolase activator NlpD